MTKTTIIARVSLKAIAAECGVSTKAARVLLRKTDMKKVDDTWSFAEAEIARVRTLLNPTKFPANPKPKRVAKPRRAKVATPAPDADADA